MSNEFKVQMVASSINEALYEEHRFKVSSYLMEDAVRKDSHTTGWPTDEEVVELVARESSVLEKFPAIVELISSHFS
jgi:hypothetical protein